MFSLPAKQISFYKKP